MAVEVGQAAPDFTLADTARQPRSLKEFAGQNVVLAFFPGAFTGGCTVEACTFRDSAAQYNGLGAQVVGVTVDSPIAQKAWADANQLTFPILSDHSRKVIETYGVPFPNFLGLEGFTSSQRAVFVIDKTGTVRHKEVVAPSAQVNFEAIAQALAALK